MAGGTWITQNKVRPGAYINVKSNAVTPFGVSERGVMTVPLELDFGPSKEVVKVSADTDFFHTFGYDLFDDAMLLMKEGLKRAKEILVYRLNTGAKATAKDGELSITAKYGGKRGNDITVKVREDIDRAGMFIVQTFMSSVLVDEQHVTTINELEGNDFVVFSGIGALQVNAGIKLMGGLNNAIQTSDYVDYLASIESLDFQTIAIPTSDSTIKTMVKNYVVRLREKEGKKCQAVVANYPEADYEGIISVKNGVKLLDGTVIDATQATVWVAAVTASAGVEKSNTYEKYDDAVDVDITYTNSKIEQALLNGEFLFVERKGAAVVEQDINTRTTFTTEQSRYFSKNRIIRTLDGLSNDMKNLWETYFIGKVNNNEDGRNLFKGMCIKLFNDYQSLGAIENFKSEDIQIREGASKDSVLAEFGAQATDSMEKLYTTLTVR